MRYSIILAVSFILLIPAIGISATLKVPGQYPTIQAAIDAASGGDTVLVAPGTYFENIDFKGKAIRVTSEQGYGVTVIDGAQTGSVVVFISGETSSSVLEGFTITNGSGTYDAMWGQYRGGGIYCYSSSPTITNNLITLNFADMGGGLSLDQKPTPVIMDNVITFNSAKEIAYYSSSGGGIFSYTTNARIEHNIISENTSEDSGGGITCYLRQAVIINNSITDNLAMDDKGGLLEELEAEA